MAGNIHGPSSATSSLIETLKPNTVPNRPAAESNAPTNVSAQTGNGDQVVITETAQKLRELEKRLASEPVVDVERVNQIRNAVLSGNYTIDPAKVAEKMISFESQLNDKLG